MCAGRYAPTGNIESGTVPTDPFMMLVAPNERFDTAAGFATANFCDSRNVSTVTIIRYKKGIKVNHDRHWHLSVRPSVALPTLLSLKIRHRKFCNQWPINIQKLKKNVRNKI